MQSLVIYSNEFDGKMDRGLAPEQYDYRFLVEGDSWMDRSSMFETSLLQQLAAEFDSVGKSVLIINLAIFGDTMRRIGSMAGGEFKLWMQTQFNWRFDALLLSAGGNDFIDAALNPPPGQGLLNDYRNVPAPSQGRDCINQGAVNDLMSRWLDPNFKALYDRVRNGRYPGLPIFLNQYDVPTARHAPAFSGGKAWLAPSYEKNGIPPALWPGLTQAFFGAMSDAIGNWATGRSTIQLVPTVATLAPATSGAIGSSGDWLNEIHPNAAGWKKLAKVWRTAITQIV